MTFTQLKFSSLSTVLVVLALLGVSQTARADTDGSTLCNKGTTPLYFATVGEHDGIFQSGAMIQGLVEVRPGGCANLVPDGMNKVILTFFQKDSRGILTNTHIVPKNATRVNSEIRHVCVNMRQPYRLFGSRTAIFSKYVNAPCPDGFSQASPAWIHQPGRRTEYQIAVDADVAAVPWKDKSGQQYSRAAVLSISPYENAGPLIEANQSSIRDRQAALALIKAAKEFKERADREAQERQARIWAEQQRRRARYEAAVDKAEESLSKPSADECAQYADKSRYKTGNEIALSGVALGMDLGRAHEALVCHDFTIRPELLARAGGVEKFWANAREKTFQKTLADGTVVFTDVETRPPRGAPPGADFVVMSVRIRYRHAERLDNSDWQRVRSDFKKKFQSGKRRAENDVAIHKQYKYDGGVLFLQLNAQDYRDGGVSQYSVSIL